MLFNNMAYQPVKSEEQPDIERLPAKDLPSEIASLQPFQVISRGSVKTEEFTKFVAEPFYMNY